MKKIFLPLLALVGMGVGFMSTSCSGGGSTDKDGPARALCPMTIELWPSVTPCFVIRYEYATTAHVCAATYSPGGLNGYKGSFSIFDSGKTDDGRWVVAGKINIDDTRILNDDQFRTMVGIGNDGNIQALREFSVYLYFPATATSGNQVTGSASVNVDGSYSGEEDGFHEFSKDYPRECSFTMTMGRLKTEFLSSEPPTYAGIVGSTR